MIILNAKRAAERLEYVVFTETTTIISVATAGVMNDVNRVHDYLAVELSNLCLRNYILLHTIHVFDVRHMMIDLIIVRAYLVLYRCCFRGG